MPMLITGFHWLAVVASSVHSTVPRNTGCVCCFCGPLDSPESSRYQGRSMAPSERAQFDAPDEKGVQVSKPKPPSNLYFSAVIPEFPPGSGPFARGRRRLSRPPAVAGRGSGLAALGPAEAPRRRIPRDSQTGSSLLLSGFEWGSGFMANSRAV